MSALFNVVLLLAVGAVMVPPVTAVNGTQNISLVEDLRRKLTLNNYDYMSEESDGLTHATPRAATPAGGPPANETGPPPVPLVPHSPNRRSGVAVEDSTTDTPSTKLKLFNVRWRAGGAARAGARGVLTRRVLREEGPRGVAVVGLDARPLPPLRLPRARRQYMPASSEYLSEYDEYGDAPFPRAAPADARASSDTDVADAGYVAGVPARELSFRRVHAHAPHDDLRDRFKDMLNDVDIVHQLIDGSRRDSRTDTPAPTDQ